MEIKEEVNSRMKIICCKSSSKWQSELQTERGSNIWD